MGTCWKMKRKSTPVPWAALRTGLSGRDWAAEWLRVLHSVDLPGGDFITLGINASGTDFAPRIAQFHDVANSMRMLLTFPLLICPRRMLYVTPLTLGGIFITPLHGSSISGTRRLRRLHIGNRAVKCPKHMTPKRASRSYATKVPSLMPSTRDGPWWIKAWFPYRSRLRCRVMLLLPALMLLRRSALLLIQSLTLFILLKVSPCIRCAILQNAVHLRPPFVLLSLRQLLSFLAGLWPRGAEGASDPNTSICSKILVKNRRFRPQVPRRHLCCL